MLYAKNGVVQGRGKSALWPTGSPLGHRPALCRDTVHACPRTFAGSDRQLLEIAFQTRPQLAQREPRMRNRYRHHQRHHAGDALSPGYKPSGLPAIAKLNACGRKSRRAVSRTASGWTDRIFESHAVMYSTSWPSRCTDSSYAAIAAVPSRDTGSAPVR